jgi:hypothetical protein
MALDRPIGGNNRFYAVRINKPKEIFTVNFSLSGVSEIEQFVGREEELAQIHERLQHASSRRIVVLHGLGGIGKTQLAVEYAKRHRKDYSAVFRMNTKDEDTLKQSFTNIARRIYRDHPSTYLKTATQSDNLDEVVDAIKRWLNHSRNSWWLLVYDNYDNPKLTGNQNLGAFDIQYFFPKAYQERSSSQQERLKSK